MLYATALLTLHAYFTALSLDDDALKPPKRSVGESIFFDSMLMSSRLTLHSLNGSCPHVCLFHDYGLCFPLQIKA